MHRPTTLLLLALPAAAAAADPWTQAASLEADGLPDEAAAALEPLVAAYPQDYALLVRLGWLHFQAGAWEAASRRYGDALALNPESWDARLGLAWTAQRAGRRSEAAGRFAALTRERPEDDSAREGLELTRSRTVVAAAGYFAAEDYGGHPDVSVGLSAGADAAVVGEAWSAGGGYRFSSYAYRPGRGAGAWAGAARSDSVRHLVHAGLSFGVPRLGGGAWGALLLDDVDELGDGRVGGLYVRWSPWGDLRLDGTVTTLDSATVPAARLSWRMPLLPWLDLTPLAEVQSDDGTARASGGARVTANWDRLALWAEGRAGALRSPVDPETMAVWTLSGLVGARAALGARVTLGDWFLFASAEQAELEIDAGTTWAETTTARWVGAGVGLTLPLDGGTP